MTTPFAYAPPLVSDEPLDGWLERIARQTMTSRRGLLSASELPQERWQRLIRDYEADDVARLSDLTGIDAQHLFDATLHRWRSLGLTPTKDQRGHHGGAWAASVVARCCPECVLERRGVHRLQWRVIWAFACTRHRRLLCAYNPSHGPFDTPPCLTPSTQLDKSHPVLAVQAGLDAILGEPTAPVAYLGTEQSAHEYLADLGALTRIVANLPDLSDNGSHLAQLARRAPADWTELGKAFSPGPVSASPAARLRQAAKAPALTAIAATTAALALGHAEPVSASERFWWMSSTSRTELIWHAAARGVSYRLWLALSEGTHLRTKSVILKRFALTRRTPTGSLLSPVDSTKLPAACWASVVPRDPRTGSAMEAIAASAALLITATDVTVSSALKILGLAHLKDHIARDWNDLFAITPAGDRNFSYLLELHEALGRGLVPIDYSRRRRTFPQPHDMGRNTKRRLLRSLDASDSGYISAHMAWFLWEILTGGDFLTSELGYMLPAQHRRQYRTRRACWLTSQPKTFYEVAEMALYRQNIDEPVTWQPELRNGLWTLPESDRRHLDVWSATNRPLRKASRAAQGVTGYGLNGLVALATAGQGHEADRARKDLRRFHAIVQQGSFKAAAAALGISPSSVTTSTAALERRLGQFLFERTGTKVTLTHAGRRLQQIAIQEGLSQDVLRSLS